MIEAIEDSDTQISTYQYDQVTRINPSVRIRELFRDVISQLNKCRYRLFCLLNKLEYWPDWITGHGCSDLKKASDSNDMTVQRGKVQPNSSSSIISIFRRIFYNINVVRRVPCKLIYLFFPKPRTEKLYPTDSDSEGDIQLEYFVTRSHAMIANLKHILLKTVIYSLNNLCSVPEEPHSSESGDHWSLEC